MDFHSKSSEFKGMHSFLFSLLGLKLVVFLSFLFYANLVSAAQVTLAWDANTETDLAGYKVYYKTSSPIEPYNGTGADQGPSPITIPLYELTNPDSPEYTLTGLDENEDYYFVVTAYDNEDPVNESAYSNWVSNSKNRLAVDFGTYGLWYYDGSGWTSLAGWDPESMKAWSAGLAVDFGTYGLWYYDGSDWTNLAGWDPDSMEAWSTGLAVDFGTYGLWYYDGSSWDLLSDGNAEEIEAWANGLFVDLGTLGLWSYNGTSFDLLMTNDAEDMEGWDFALAVDFNDSGLWNYDGSEWSILTTWDAEDMIDVDLF